MITRGDYALQKSMTSTGYVLHFNDELCILKFPGGRTCSILHLAIVKLNRDRFTLLLLPKADDQIYGSGNNGKKEWSKQGIKPGSPHRISTCYPPG